MDFIAADIMTAVLGTILALLEVQIEGPHGWAAQLPTWRPQGPIARAASRSLGGKPVTGYHLVLLLFLLGVVHLPAAFVPWSAELEGWAFSRFFLLTAFWDFQWFALNKHYGLRRFHRNAVWWHKRWIGRVPLDYLFALALAALTGAWWPADFGIGVAIYALETMVVVGLALVFVEPDD